MPASPALDIAFKQLECRPDDFEAQFREGGLTCFPKPDTTIVAGIDTDDAKASQDVSKGPLVTLLHLEWKNSSSNHE